MIAATSDSGGGGDNATYFNTYETVKFETGKLTAINAILLFVTTWVTLSLFVYGRKEGHLRCDTKGGKMYLACAVTMIVGFFRHLIDIAILNVDFNSASCEWMADISSFFNGIAGLLVHLVLWYRQHCINSDEKLKSSLPKALRIVSYISLIVNIAGAVVLFCVYTVPVSNMILPQFGCSRAERFNSSKKSKSQLTPLIFLFLLTSGQLLLLFLFIYPMCVVYRRSKNSNCGVLQNDTITRKVRRALICFVIGFLTDIMSTILMIPLSFPPSVGFVRTISSIDIAINQIVMIAMFDFFSKLMCYLVYRPTITS